MDVPRATFPLRPDAMQDLLAGVFGRPVEVLGIDALAHDRAPTELKHVGYGEPLRVRVLVEGERRDVVLRTMSPNAFGHDRRADRAALALLAFDTYDLLPRHVRPLDVGAVTPEGRFVSLRTAHEPYLLTTYVEGDLYAHDLRRVEERGRAEPLDVERARALAGYLADLHGEPIAAPSELYVRALRDLVGSGEGVFGLVDSYPDPGPVDRARLRRIEHACVDWRHALRPRAARLARTHGDFHPYNLLFREGVDLSVLDTSRGSVGEPADDLAALAVNFVFGAVLYPAAIDAGLAPLWDAFFGAYLARRGDEVLEVIAPFFAWRALVVASPVWYPAVSAAARDTLLSFAERALAAPRVDVTSLRRLVLP